MASSSSSSLLLLCPLPAVIVGALVARQHGVGWSAYAPSFVGVALGASAMLALCRLRRESVVMVPLVALLPIAMTLVDAGVEGVRRWLPLGPLMLNASAAFAPLIVMGLCHERSRARVIALGVAVGAQLVHVAQPDAGQATALAAGALPLLASRDRYRREVGWPAAALLTLLAAATWRRPDPLDAVDHVERILHLIGAGGAVWVIVAMVALVALVAPFALALRAPSTRSVALAALAYLTAAFVVTFVGNFPVPVFGAGAGHVLGWYALVLGASLARDK